MRGRAGRFSHNCIPLTLPTFQRKRIPHQLVDNEQFAGSWRLIVSIFDRIEDLRGWQLAPLEFIGGGGGCH